MAARQLPAVSIAITDGARVVWSEGFGLADPDAKTPAAAETVYRVGSVSKLFTDIGVMQLVERGELDLDAPIARYLPQFHPKNPFGQPITLRQLMSHRAGLVREPPDGNYFDSTSPSLEKTVLSLNRTELVYKPGTHTKYSNAGIAVVGYVLEKTQHEPFAKYLKGNVLAPLGLEHSAFEPEPVLMRSLAKAYMWSWHREPFLAPTFELGMAPCGSMYSTVNDLAKFITALSAGGAPVLRRETLEQMWTPQFATSGDQTKYGLGFRVGELEHHRMVGHGGAIYGFSTELEALPGEQIGVVVATNKDGENAATARIANAALRLMLAAREHRPLPAIEPSKPPVPPTETFGPMPALPPARWRSFIAEYGWDYNILYIHERKGKLTSLIEWFFFDPLEEISANQFRFPPTSLYDGETLTITPQYAKVGEVVFPRRPDPAAPGATFRIQLVRPIEEVRREAMAAQPPREKGEFLQPDLVDVATLDKDIRLDIRYAGTNNFMGTPFYTRARAFLQRPAAEALVRAQRNLKQRGYALLLHDGYRPWYVTKMFWDATPPDKHIFEADPRDGSRHNRGCAIDLTMYELASGKEVPMVSGYDEMTERAFPDYPGGTSQERWFRALLRRSMEAEGFDVFPVEWWHFDYRDWRKYPILNIPFERIAR